MCPIRYWPFYFRKMPVSLMNSKVIFAIDFLKVFEFISLPQKRTSLCSEKYTLCVVEFLPPIDDPYMRDHSPSPLRKTVFFFRQTVFLISFASSLMPSMVNFCMSRSLWLGGSSKIASDLDCFCPAVS